MSLVKVFLTIILLTAATSASAQKHHDSKNHQPYADLKGRDIKALSQQQIDDLKAGKGMSLALAAELNGYPGPSHVLELADQLKLNEKQKKRMQEMFKAMTKETKTLGVKVIEAERKLDALFKSKKVNEQNLKETTLKAGEAQAKLREAHLRYHLSTLAVLSKEQVDTYNRLRGYR
jgi:Spy/CpxP family protein refolding chaperone